MTRAMIFIDGTWLYHTIPTLGEAYGVSKLRIDYGRLPSVLATKVNAQFGDIGVDIVRTHVFASFPKNHDLADDEAVQSVLDFYGMLKEDYHYEVELFPIDFRGRRVSRRDRVPDDTFEPKEKCVDVALATQMPYYAAIPNAYDIAVPVVGDRDYIPVLQAVRRLGRRVAMVSVKGIVRASSRIPWTSLESRTRTFCGLTTCSTTSS